MQKAMAAHEHNKKKALEPRVTEPIILPEKKIEPAPQRAPARAPTPEPEPAKSQPQPAAETTVHPNATAAAIAQYGFTYDMSALYAAYNLAMPTVGNMGAVNMMPGYSFPNVDVTAAMNQTATAGAATAPQADAAAAAPTEAPTSSKAAVTGSELSNVADRPLLWETPKYP